MANHDNIEDFAKELIEAVTEATKQGHDVSGMVAKEYPDEEGPETGLNKKKVRVCWTITYTDKEICIWRWTLE